jgi:hypothetical protein
LDAYHWQTYWVDTPKDEWTQNAPHLSDGHAWVMDDNDTGFLEPRQEFLDGVEPVEKIPSPLITH